MNKITYPLRLRQKGAAIADLHAALIFLAEKRHLVAADPDAGSRLAAALENDRDMQVFGAATKAAVASFQTGRDIEANGEVDGTTAKAINRLLKDHADDRRDDRAEAPAMMAIHEDVAGDEVLLIQEALTKAGFRVAPPERSVKRFGASTRAALEGWRAKNGRLAGGAIDADERAALVAEARDMVRSVRGTISLRSGGAAVRLKLVAFDRDFRAEEALGQATTDSKGRYRIAYTAAAMARAEKAMADIGLRIFAHDGKSVLYETPTNDLLMNAPVDARLDAVIDAPEGTIPSEFEQIAGELKPLVGDVAFAAIGDAGHPDDGAFLVRETGREASQIVHFVMAHRLEVATGIAPEWFYALLREDGLHGMTPDRPRAQLLPVSFASNVETLVFEATLLDDRRVDAAIARALRKRLVGPEVAKQTAAARKALAPHREKGAAHVRSALRNNALDILGGLITTGEAPRLSALLDGSDLEAAPALFAKLDSNGAFDPGKRNTARARVELGMLLGLEPRLVEEVVSAIPQATSSEGVRDLARLRPAEWAKHINTATQTAPGVPSDDAQSLRLGRIVARRFETRYPTVAAAAQLKRARNSAVPHHKEVADFLEAHPDLELRDQRLTPFLKQAKIDHVSIAPDVRLGVEKFQRVLQLTGSYEKGEALLKAGYGASADIVAAGKGQFLTDAARSGGIGVREAARIFEVAENRNYAAITLAGAMANMNLPEAVQGQSSQALSLSIQQVVADQPDLAALFGARDACACEHCRSIYGPAAYFADVMRFLRDRLVRTTANPALPGTRAAKDALFARRPDLGNIDLNCANALVEVPHIDIFCELAEEAFESEPPLAFNGAVTDGPAPAALLAAIRVHFPVTDAAIIYGPHTPGKFVLRDETIVMAIDGPGPNWSLRRLRQTHGTSEERAASPEYVNAAAYARLRTQKVAFGLPFDLFHAETRAFMAAAGIDRADLMENLAVAGSPAPADIAGEILGLSSADLALVATQAVADQPEIWDVTAATAAPTMRRLDRLTQRTALDYAGVEALIAGAYVRGSANLFIKHLDASCDLDEKQVENLTDTVLDRIHRVIRLARATGLTIADVDRLANAPNLGGGQLGTAAVQSLADLTVLSRDLAVGIDSLITWLHVIPARGNRSAHARLFENPAITGKLANNLSAVQMAAHDSNQAAAPLLGMVATDLAIVFGAKAADIDAIVARLASLQLAPLKLSSRALAAVLGRVRLARALGLRVDFLLLLERLAAVDPLASTARFAAFVRDARIVVGCGVTVPDLAHQLARLAPDPALRDLATPSIAAALTDLRARLRKAAADSASPFDSSLSSTEQVVPLEKLLQQQPGIGIAAIAALLEPLRAAAPDAAMATAAKAVVDAPHDAGTATGIGGLVDQIAVKAAIDLIIATPGETERLACIALMMGGLSASALAQQAQEAAVAAAASLIAAPADSALAILNGSTLAVGPATPTLFALFTAGAIADETVALTVAAAPQLYRAARLAQAIAAMTRPFSHDAGILSFVLANATGANWLDLDTIPFETGMAAVPIADWLELADLFAIFKEFPPVAVPGQPGVTVAPQGIFAMALGGAAKADLLFALAALSGWPLAILVDVDTWLGLAVADYRTPVTWRAVARGVDRLNRLGLPMTEAVGLCKATLTEADRQVARRMLASRYDPQDWLGALKVIIDPIREAKRDALAAALLADNPTLNSVEDLYDHFLTNPSWSAKMPSSRLVHAHGTLQLFIQRCIAALEPAAVADLDNDQAWQWWDWMRNYRVWEVGRKVFVDAQYYLRPAWRDDKTEPFQAFEGAIMQNEIKQENIEAAYEGYLDELDRIAFLDVLATCFDFDRDILHVFGSTKGGDPRGYYHRTLHRERVWTPWRKLDLDITGEHLIAFFRNKRLCLAWATFVEKGDEEQESTFPEPTGSQEQLPQSKRWSEIKLAMSEYTGTKWLPRRVSEGFVKTQSAPQTLDRASVFLTVSPGSNFRVDVCERMSTLTKKIGAFELTGCKGYPEVRAGSGAGFNVLPAFVDTQHYGQRLIENGQDNNDNLAIVSGLSGTQTLFGRTPGTFRISYPFQQSIIDQLLTWLFNLAMGQGSADGRGFRFFGTLMPFFFEDNRHGYVLIPGFYGKIDPNSGTRTTVKTFSNVSQFITDLIAWMTEYAGKFGAATTQAETDAVWQELIADPDTARIFAEFQSYGGTDYGIVVRNFYHPLACFLRERFFEGGIPALLARQTQLHVGAFTFEHATQGYDPDSVILPHYPRVELEFGRESAYATYNWELTFHAPHLIATQLIEAKQFADAERWLRYIFNPLGSSNDPAPQRYWNTKPFYQRGAADYGLQMIDAIMGQIAKDPGGVIETELVDAVTEWRSSPFKPYLVARSRTVAFQQAIVDLTIRLYLAWGDDYFRRDQLEDLVMADLYYSRAERLLGRRPAVVPHAVTPPPETYNQLEAKLDLFGNALRSIENLLPDFAEVAPTGAELPPLPLTYESLYFCIPPSEKLFELWDVLQERRFNLNNSRTIDGVERSLSLFAPPLSVEELIKASAAGLSISAILSGMSAPRPPYRFRVMLRHAIELADIAAGFSGKMEQAIAGRDGELLTRLKIEHEIDYMARQTAVLKDEIKAAGRTLASAKRAENTHLETQEFYANRLYMNGFEIAATVANGVSFGLQTVVAIGYAASGGLALVPSFMIGAAGFGGSPTANGAIGGQNFSSSARDFVVGAIGAAASAVDKAAAMLDKQASYLVRMEDWQHAAKQAGNEAKRAAIEVDIAKIREGISKEQLRLHGVKQQQATAELAYLKNKFTSAELFDWQAQQLRGLSRQMFNLAAEAARAAERCSNYELGATDSYVRPGQWNDTRRGILAAENLALDLRRMESAYLKRNVREREMVKEVSLAQIDPLALMELRASGHCVFQLPEALFDLEHPGHYFRRIKSLSVEIPAVAGPHTSIPVKLTQTSNRVRVNPTRTAGAASDAEAYAEVPGNDQRFKYNVGSIETIETSHGLDDGGVFNLDLNDERYLPFEGSGLVGSFVVEMLTNMAAFDRRMLADIKLRIRYTARDGGGGFRTLVSNGMAKHMDAIALRAGRVGLFHAIDLRRDRPDAWHRLITNGAAELTASLGDLPWYTNGRPIAIKSARLVGRINGAPATFPVSVNGNTVMLGAPPEAGLAGSLSATAAGIAFNAPMTLAVQQHALLDELALIVNYSVS